MKALACGSTLGVSLAVLAGCAGSDTNSTPRPAPEPPPSAAAVCKKAMGGGGHSGTATWRQGVTTVGSFGLIGPASDFHWSGVRQLKNGQYLAKLPAIVHGTAPVVVWVPRSERDRVALDYGDFWTAHSIRDGDPAITFKPCRSQPNTTWPGGLVMKSRHPITLQVAIGGELPRSLEVGAG
jgi:hypothetical protein